MELVKLVSQVVKFRRRLILLCINSVFQVGGRVKFGWKVVKGWNLVRWFVELSSVMKIWLASRKRLKSWMQLEGLLFTPVYSFRTHFAVNMKNKFGRDATASNY